MKVQVGGYYGTYIDVSYTTGAAHITNNSALLTALNNYGAYAVADAVKTMYQRLYYKDLKVSRTSMAIEIIGHVIPDQVCQIILNSSLVPQTVKNAAASVVRHTSVIDSGESSVDSNRWFWDALAAISSVVSAILNLF